MSDRDELYDAETMPDEQAELWKKFSESALRC